MGADFLFSIVPACKLTPERLVKLTELVNETFKDYDDNENSYSKDEVLEAIDEVLGGGFDDSREVSVVWIRGAAYYVTGGMSWGDGPTEAFDTMCKLGDYFEQLEAWALEDNAKK